MYFPPTNKLHFPVQLVISISIMYFNLGSGKDYLYHGMTQFKGVHTGEILTVKHLVNVTDKSDKIVRKFVSKGNVYPEYYLIEVDRFEDVISEDIDEWVYFFKNETIKDNFKSRNIQEAKKKLSILKMDDAARKTYERYLISLASERDVLDTAMLKGKIEGEIDDRIEDILEELNEKGIVSVFLESQIREQKDLDILKKWLRLAYKSASVEEFSDLIKDSN